MATPSSSLTPPPDPSGGSSAQQGPPTSQQASPAPATPSPQMQQGTQMLLTVVNGLRAIGKAFPGAAPGVAEINEIIRGKLMPAIMAHAEPSEPAAPPVGG